MAENLNLEDTTQGRENALRELYIQQLRQVAKYTWAFRNCADEKVATLYYLIHATNHMKGVLLMKEVTQRGGTQGQFAYLGPDDLRMKIQPRLIPEPDNIEFLQNQLPSICAGRTLTFDQIREETWELPFVETQYRRALQDLRKQNAG